MFGCNSAVYHFENHRRTVIPQLTTNSVCDQVRKLISYGIFSPRKCFIFLYFLWKFMSLLRSQSVRTHCVRKSRYNCAYKPFPTVQVAFVIMRALLISFLLLTISCSLCADPILFSRRLCTNPTVFIEVYKRNT